MKKKKGPGREKSSPTVTKHANEQKKKKCDTVQENPDPVSIQGSSNTNLASPGIELQPMDSMDVDIEMKSNDKEREEKKEEEPQYENLHQISNIMQNVNRAVASGHHDI